MTKETLNLGDAAADYLAGLSKSKQETNSSAVRNFVRWYGSTQCIVNLSSYKLEEYSRAQQSAEDGANKIKAVREFMKHAVKKGWINKELPVHLKIKKTTVKKKPVKVTRPNDIEKLVLTPEKKQEMETELSGLKEKRIIVIDDIKRAAADKDLKENAPYHAAREEKAKLDGKINELTLLLKHAEISHDAAQINNNRVVLGCSITVKEVDTGEISEYKLVIPRDVNIKKGCISLVSPIGKALLGKKMGETVEVVAPNRVLRYCIESIS